MSTRASTGATKRATRECDATPTHPEDRKDEHILNRPTNIDTQFRELAHRANNGVNVTLSWRAETDELLVCVYDERRDVYFEIQPDRDFALDVYYHPYAHVGYGDDGLAA